MKDYDVIVVGAGNAALAAAASAREAGAERVLVLEKAPEPMRGGNTHYSGGLYRCAFDDPEELRGILPGAEEEVPGFFDLVQPYSAEAFRADLHRVTEGRTDPELSELLIARSLDTVRWLKERGIVMEAAVSLSAVRHQGKMRFSPGAVVRAKGEGVGLSMMWFSIMEDLGVEVRYETAATGLLQEENGRIGGVRTTSPLGLGEIRAGAVVLGSGGFEANPAWRARYLGAPWDQARVRGTPFNTGDGLRMAFDLEAAPHGQYTGCHSTPIDANAPPHGDRKLTDKTNRLSYPYGVLLNREGVRFFDEGEDFQFYTYAKLGGIILNQPGGVSWQIFDQRAVPLLEPRYVTGTPLEAQTLEALVAQLPIPHDVANATLAAYNKAAGKGKPDAFDPTVLDGLRAEDPKGLGPPKSNWALPLTEPPFLAYPATGGITFTFGGLRVDTQARVMGTHWRPLDGLYACGELVGGLFHHNYPGGTGLMSGAVFGRIAGREAARMAAGS